MSIVVHADGGRASGGPAPDVDVGGVAAAERAAAPARILIVDDDNACRHALRRDLRAHGYDVLTARHGLEALDLLCVYDVGVVVSDLAMPRMDGLELLLRLAHEYPALPVIAMTGASTPVLRLYSAAERGAFETLCKPFGVEDLLEALERALRG